jgi:glycerol 2-dehydrogenase (NADP+)
MSFTCPQPELLAYLKKKDILAQAYSPLGSTGASHTSMEVIEKLAKKHNVEGANILISWQVGRGANPVPKSVTPSRIENNGKLVNLSSEELKELEEASLKQPFKKVCDQSESFDYDIYEADHPENSDKAQWAKLSSA